MLNNKINYVGKQAEIYGTGNKDLDGKKVTIIGQFPSDRDGLIFDINKSNPKNKNNPYSVKESQCKIL